MKLAIGICAVFAASICYQPAVAATTTAAVKKTHHHVAAHCSDKVLCHKIDSLSANLNRNFQSLGTSVAAGQAASADYQAKSLQNQADTLTLVKSIEGYEAQGAQVQHAIYFSFDDKPLDANEDPSATATKVCTDAGFKAGKPVDISQTHHIFSSNQRLLKSVVCTY